MTADQTTHPTAGDDTTGTESSMALDTQRPPVDVTHDPPRLTQTVAVLALLIGALVTTPFATLALPFGLAGLSLGAGALFVTHSRAWLTTGTALVLCGVIVTGAYGAVPPAVLLVGVGATLLAWDVGQHGLVIGEQLGREPSATRNLLVHATTSLVLISVVSAVAYLGYLVAGRGHQAAAVTALLLGLVILAWVFRR